MLQTQRTFFFLPQDQSPGNIRRSLDKKKRESIVSMATAHLIMIKALRNACENYLGVGVGDRRLPALDIVQITSRQKANSQRVH